MDFGKLIFGLIILGFTVFANGQENSNNPIDIVLTKCLKTEKATMARAKCYSNASESWQEAVTKDYQKLLNLLSPEIQLILKDEQKAWEKYRIFNESFVMAKYGKRKGSGYISVRIIELMKPYRERALELESRFEDK
ncbi:MAG: DUF1311 domain-containing protein [Pyrinomonadaceae bacterium]|nr:DUF1311 domain-containing protein [Pyrinomonadaceae bacterium]